MASEFDFFENETGAQSSNSGIDPRLILIKMVRNWPIVIVSIAIGLLGAFFYHRYTNEQFRMTSSLLIPDSNSSVDQSILQLFSVSNTSQFLNEIEILKSERMTSLALDTLNFDVEYYSVGRIKTVEEYNSLPFEIIMLPDEIQSTEVIYTITFQEANNFTIGRSGSDVEDLVVYQPYEDINDLGLSIRVEFSSSRDLNGKSYN